jgi:thiosulfate/3-mercaptopyruvate sulfurtransferase
MNPIVSTSWLADHLHDPNLIVADIRHVATEPGAGFRFYLAGHIPGAVFLDVDSDLADRSDLTKGRHPLPDPRVFVRNLSRVGIGKGMRVVAYDDKAGSNAARLWWMLRWIGVSDVAVLDGGIPKWISEQRPLESGESPPRGQVTPFDPTVNTRMVVSKGEVLMYAQIGLLLDARSPERFRGEIEPIDVRAGHIPGAVNAPWEQNITGGEDPVLLSPTELREHYRNLGVSPDRKVACYCGSGVTACHDILALEIAGFPGARLYPGSWSEWIVDSPLD